MMRSVNHGIDAVQTDALFVSRLQSSDEPTAAQVRQAVTAAIRAFGYSGCAGRVAQEFGDHPKTALIRMRWVRGAAREAFADSPAEPGPGTNAAGVLVIRPRMPAEQASGAPGAGWREPARSATGSPGPCPAEYHPTQKRDYALPGQLADEGQGLSSSRLPAPIGMGNAADHASAGAMSPASILPMPDGLRSQQRGWLIA